MAKKATTLKKKSTSRSVKSVAGNSRKSKVERAKQDGKICLALRTATYLIRKPDGEALSPKQIQQMFARSGIGYVGNTVTPQRRSVLRAERGEIENNGLPCKMPAMWTAKQFENQMGISIKLLKQISKQIIAELS